MQKGCLAVIGSVKLRELSPQFICVSITLISLTYMQLERLVLMNMHKTFREFNDKTFMIDEFSYFGISKPDAEKRKAIWKKSRLGSRLVKKANGKYIVYREYHGDKNKVDSSSLFLEG